ERDDLRDEEDGAGGGAEPAAQMLANDLRDPETDADRQQREVEDQLERIADGHQQIGFGQYHPVVVETTKLGGADAVPPQQGIVDRRSDRDQYEGAVEQQGRCDEEPGYKSTATPVGGLGSRALPSKDRRSVSHRSTLLGALARELLLIFRLHGLQDT